MDKSKVLITGSNGLLGQQLRQKLSSNFFVIATGIGPDTSKFKSDKYVEMDVSSFDQCQKVLYKYAPSVIINAAAMTNVDDCERIQKRCYNINLNSANNFLPYLVEKKPHFIHVSTDFVFNGCKGSYIEEDKPDPINYYGFCKLQYEKIILKHCVNYTIIRTSLIYGLNDDRYNFLNWVKENLIKNIKMNIVSDQFRTPTFVNDLALVINDILYMKKYGVFHISSGEKLSIFDFVCNIARHYGLNDDLVKKTDSTSFNQFAKRPLDTSLNIDKAINILKFKPTKLTNALTKIS